MEKNIAVTTSIWLRWTRVSPNSTKHAGSVTKIVPKQLLRNLISAFKTTKAGEGFTFGQCCDAFGSKEEPEKIARGLPNLAASVPNAAQNALPDLQGLNDKISRAKVLC